jgi:type IV pilus assembly protein PilA
MAQQPKQPMSTGIKVLIGASVGCGCLFVGIILLGILSAIMLPSFLNQANKAKQSEGKQQTGTLMRSQQAYFIENKKFARSAAELGVRLPAEGTSNYRYQIQPIPGKRPAVIIQALPNNPQVLKSFLGIVLAKGETTETLICQSQQPGPITPTVKLPTSPGDPLSCPSGMVAPAAP